MNKSLVSKWIFNYANNMEAPWRKVVCARSKGNLSSIRSTMENNGNNLVLWKFVGSMMERSGRVKEVIDQQFKILIGARQDTDFWNDSWTDKGPRRMCFLRIFALDRVKSESMINFGK